MITDLIKPPDYRYERKFFISGLNRFEVEQIITLHPALFLPVYHQRFVNNIYMDTLSLSNYLSNVYGLSQRLKTRIRWYGNKSGLIENPVLELKIKEGYLGGKIRYPLAPFPLDDKYSMETLHPIFVKAAIPDEIAEYLKSLQCTLLNRYTRKYFESADKKFRITLDFDIEVYRIDPVSNSFNEKKVDYDNVILELKYSKENDEEARFITNYLPFRMSKSSKYARGIEGIYPYIY